MTLCKKGVWTIILSIVGISLFLTSYCIPTSSIFSNKAIMITLFISGIMAIITSIILSVLSIKSKESGLSKYIGLFINVLFLLCLLLIPIIMGVFGFREP